MLRGEAMLANLSKDESDPRQRARWLLCMVFGLNTAAVGVVWLLFSLSVARMVNPKLDGIAYWTTVAGKLFRDWSWVPTTGAMILVVSGAAAFVVGLAGWRDAQRIRAQSGRLVIRRIMLVAAFGAVLGAIVFLLAFVLG